MSGQRTFNKSEEGLALIEFAFAIPVLIILFIGVVELTRYVLIVQKIEKSVSQIPTCRACGSD
jgi:Flp pilus assembly protein TadG